MRIGINLRCLQKPISGIERATLELLKMMEHIHGNHAFVGYITERSFASSQVERELQACCRLELRRVRLLREDPAFRLCWDLFGVAKLAARDRLDLFWGPSFSLPFSLMCPGIVSIYDLAFIYFPAAYDRSTRLFHRVVTRLSARRACAILTISESSKKDVERHLHIPGEKVYVSPLGCDLQFRSLREEKLTVTDTLSRHNVRRPFWLSVAQISPRKNLSHLVRVFAWLRRERQVSHQLVLAGGNGWLCEDVYSTVQKEGVEDAVVFTGRIPDEELIELYNAAELFVYPSLYEGFGLPVLEAMACGAPVVVSNSSSLPEVVGDAGVLVSPTNDRDLGEAILELSRNPARRAELSERGKARAAQFSWKRSAEVVLDVFRRSAGAH